MECQFFCGYGNMKVFRVVLFVYFCLCNSALGVVHSQVCSANCSVVAHGSGPETGTQNFINCSCQQSCSDDHRSAHIVAPTLRGSDFYPYSVANSSFQQLALNFSWGPTHDSTIRRTIGYSVSISSANTVFTLSYCLATPLDFNKHRHAQFFFDCFGYSTGHVIQPGDKFSVRIKALPRGPGKDLVFNISIPSCGDDDSRVKNVKDCVLERQLNMIVAGIMCDTHSVLLHYHVPKAYGEKAKFIVCTSEGRDLCGCTAAVTAEVASGVNGTYIMQLPYGNKLARNYTIILCGTSRNDRQTTQMVTFEECLPDAGIYHVSLLIVAFAIIILSGVLILTVHCCVNHNKSAASTQVIAVPADDEEQMKIEPKTVYLVSASCGPCHDKVLLAFASYLQEELGLKVIFHLWDQEKVISSVSQYIKTALEDADKVLFIWTPNATDLYERYNRGEAVEDMSSPVLKKIEEDKILNKNIGKYYFAYFNYCDLTSFQLFRKGWSLIILELMSDFKTLYFHLIDAEQYQPGGIISLDRIEDYASTKHGKSIERAVSELCMYSRNNKNWYIQQNTSFDLYRMPRQCILRHRLELDEVPPLV